MVRNGLWRPRSDEQRKELYVRLPLPVTRHRVANIYQTKARHRDDDDGTDFSAPREPDDDNQADEREEVRVHQDQTR